MNIDLPWDLEEDLKNRPRGPFKPVLRYSRIGDMVEIHFEEDPAFAVQVNEYLTLLRAFSDRRLVGVKIFGVGPLVRKADEEHGGVS